MTQIAIIEPKALAACCSPLVGGDMSNEAAEASAVLLRALADPTRIRIVNLLANSPEPVCVCDLNENFDLSQPTVSHHLKKLVSAGLLAREQRGTWAYFSLNQNALKQLAKIFNPGGEA
jgi:ArsR family transcriptional regulator, arsenate/arsenite/antimonite-responsive transcriptional repressor